MQLKFKLICCLCLLMLVSLVKAENGKCIIDLRKRTVFLEDENFTFQLNKTLLKEVKERFNDHDIHRKKLPFVFGWSSKKILQILKLEKYDLELTFCKEFSNWFISKEIKNTFYTKKSLRIIEIKKNSKCETTEGIKMGVGFYEVEKKLNEPELFYMGSQMPKNKNYSSAAFSVKPSDIESVWIRFYDNRDSVNKKDFILDTISIGGF